MSQVYHGNTYGEPNTLLDAALAYARSGLPLFPLRPSTKKPLHSGGFHNATTDENKIRQWWEETPEANIGLPTGKESGFIVLDVDPEDGGRESLAALEAKHGKLPDTWTVRTGGGGYHLWLKTPASEEIPTNAGVLGAGLDLRGTGTGYTVAPPSITESVYEVVERAPLAEIPAWLLEEIARPRGGTESLRSAGKKRKEESGPVSIDTAGPTIYEGTRNDSLARIAGKLHDGTRTLAQLSRDLQAVNETRCSTPLPEGELEKIAKSIYWREPCRPSNKAPEHVLEMLDIFEDSTIWGNEWKGMGGRSDRSATVALLRFARRYGKPYTAPGEDRPTGVEVSVDIRSLALETGVRDRGMKKAVRRIRENQDLPIFRKSTGGDGIAGTFILDCCATVHPSNHFFSSRGSGEEEKNLYGWGGVQLRAPFTAPRLRWSAPDFDRGVRVGTIRRLGKTVEMIVDILEVSPDGLDDAELAGAMNLARVRDLRREDGPLERAVAAGVVVDEGGHTWLSEDWLEALNRERELAGEIEAYRRDQAKYEREREARSTRHERPVDLAPTTEEMDLHRDSRADRRRDCIERALVSLFDAKPEYRNRRVGQVTCALWPYLPEPFPRGVDPGGPPKDSEVASILEENGVDVA